MFSGPSESQICCSFSGAAHERKPLSKPHSAMAMFTGNDAVLPFLLRVALDRVDGQLDELIYEAFPQAKAA